MSRRGRRNAALAGLAAVLVLAPADRARADELGSYLEQHGLTELLVLHLEQQLEKAAPAEVAPIIDRLAGLYAQLLESADDSQSRENFQERARKLLGVAQAADNRDGAADELRLALARGTYRQIEKIAESHRLRLASTEELARAQSLLEELVPELAQVRLRAKERADLRDRQLARASGSNAVLLSAEVDEARSLLNQASFLQAWALYYKSWVDATNEPAMVAQTLFAELLGLDREQPRPEEVTVDLRGIESIARSILGLALCKSLTASSSTALMWLRLLEDDRTFAPLRAEVPAWKIVTNLQHRDYVRVREIWDALKQGSRPIPLPWVRLVVVHSMEAPPDNFEAGGLVRSAVAELAARGELQQILELADQFGAERLGESGFALHYVRALQRYQAARTAHGGDRPTADAAVQAMYRTAAAQLEGADHEPDADRFAEARAAARLLVGWCRYFEGKLLVAVNDFEQAASMLPPDQAAEALWMAIVCLDTLAEARPLSEGAPRAGRLTALVDRFLQSYPSHQRAPTLVLKRALAAREPSMRLVDELLAIPSESEVHNAAQRRAADILYALWRGAPADDAEAATSQLVARFLDVSASLLRSEMQAREAGQAIPDEQVVNRCRRMLEAALAEGQPVRMGAASEALQALEALRASGVDLKAVDSEISFRRVQERLAALDMPGAEATAEIMWIADPDSAWTRAAERLLLKRHVDAWRRGSQRGDSQRQSLQSVIKHGRRVLVEFQPHVGPLSDPAALACAMAVAEASMKLWELAGDAKAGREALELYSELLTSRPRDPAILRGAGLLGTALGDKQKALECWRVLAAGTTPGSESWCEAKFNLLTLLAELDAPRAREAMDQHKVLNPDYGPEPWKSRLKALDERIPRSASNARLEAESPAKPAEAHVRTQPSPSDWREQRRL